MTVRVETLLSRYRSVRQETESRAAPLSDADATPQSMADASPAKWHLAHTSWFFEQFILSAYVPEYEAFDADFAYLFNSYYEAAGPRHQRSARGLITRPALDRVRAYRAHVDDAVARAMPDLGEEARALITLGLHHEEQHQELMLTDILHLFAQNPLEPVYAADGVRAEAIEDGLSWHDHAGGLVEIGHEDDGFAFDCEGPRHKVHLEPFALASRLVTNAEWDEFIDDGGYQTAALWLSDGWAWVNGKGITGPLYWRAEQDNRPSQFSLRGRRRLDPAAPVTHISYYEADAFATWAGLRLPTEAEWETRAPSLADAHGQCWQWTGSAYLPYPRFRAAAGAVGEYNGKFMSGQFVLRGSSCATPAGHARDSYRNFFYPHQRWQFAGVRLAKSL
ncbi:ergothioneine biosynthesis protein EgtB [Pacificimonas sp. WHA3]|uniref:Ergothioneine biosynthesis protein EgtB n=1 Tax=Pacificimonas pallii TaxID=2827236 RepID=A0ABS6SAW9_9SPHN|nr:ergothioneine biosynthesis protein EgtB [Pacificimonas pallii]MBV7255563.1 ergothioneine biosynthesis protein EgtB [Pacificimonas pallii]